MNPRQPHSVPNNSENSYGSVIKELGITAINLAQSELSLLKTEIKTSAPNLLKHAAQTGIFGALSALSTLPFLAFVVIGLGILFGGAYWLSALVVSVICASVGGYFGYRAFQKLKSQDLTFTRTRDGLAKAAHMIENKINEVKSASKGGSHESTSIH